MAKKKISKSEITLPDDTAPAERSEEAVAVAPPVPVAVTIEVPLGPIGEGYLTRHVEAQLDLPQRRALRGLLIGLQVSEERLANGRPIKKNSDGIKWLLQEIAKNEP